MTIPTPATPTGYSVTNPAGGGRAAEENSFAFLIYCPCDLIFRLRSTADDECDDDEWLSNVLRQSADTIARYERERAAVEKALAAWDAYNETEESQWAIDEAMSALRAIHAETKGNL